MLWGLINWDLMGFHFNRRQLFYKQADANFFGVFNYAISEWLAELPITLVLGVFWTCGTFFLVDLYIANFGYYWLFFLATTFYFHQLFRFITAIGPVHSACDGLAFGFFTFAFTLSAYLVTFHSMIGLQWATWLFPLIYVWRGLCVMELMRPGSQWNPDLTNDLDNINNVIAGNLIPCVADTCDEICDDSRPVTFNGASISVCSKGSAALKVYDLPTSRNYIGYAYIFMYCNSVLLLFMYAWAMKYLRVGQKDIKLIRNAKDVSEEKSFSKRKTSARLIDDLIDINAIQTTPITLTLRDLKYTVQVQDPDNKTFMSKLKKNSVNFRMDREMRANVLVIQSNFGIFMEIGIKLLGEMPAKFQNLFQNRNSNS